MDRGTALHPTLRRLRAGFPARLVAGLIALLPGAAAAQFAVCNQSFDVINVAIGLDTGDEFETEGWWTVGPNQCANVIREGLTSRYIYIHAQDVFGQPVLGGTTRMCVSPRRFQIRGIGDCWARGHVSARFIEVDTSHTERWTLFLGMSQ